MQEHPGQFHRLSRVLVHIATLLQTLGPRAGIVARVTAMHLRSALHRAMVTPCPFCGAPHRALAHDPPDGTAVELQCHACDRFFEAAVNGFGDVDVYGKIPSQPHL